MTEQLTAVMNEIEQYVASAGWDQPTRLFALVDTADLVKAEPAMAARLGSEPEPGSLTPIEQDGLGDGPLDELLGQIGWPPEVIGCAVVDEVLVLPPGAEQDAPEESDEQAASEWAAAHPERREVRLAVGVLRDGTRMAALRLRAETAEPGEEQPADEVMFGPDLAPTLAEALLETFRDD